MSKITGIVKEDGVVVKGETTLVRRVSNMIKDGSYSGPPMLFRHPSMEKIRHCCQNLNLFPYLLYSYDNSKSHPIARKVNLCLNHILKGITESFFVIYESLRKTILRRIQSAEPSGSVERKEHSEDILKVTAPSSFQKFERKKPKQNNPVFLVIAVYVASLIIAFQLVGLCSLMIIGKYTPGFIFLITALLFLGGITLKILLHETLTYGVSSAEKRKVQ
ncbi:uncharacterized protein [Prorops nasuta]|uniref:uncharacterized protein n=1 Tax=Prorops nasuta TaxID=863751 RepID=UPI0034CD3BE7